MSILTLMSIEDKHEIFQDGVRVGLFTFTGETAADRLAQASILERVLTAHSFDTQPACESEADHAGRMENENAEKLTPITIEVDRVKGSVKISPV